MKKWQREAKKLIKELEKIQHKTLMEIIEVSFRAGLQIGEATKIEILRKEILDKYNLPYL